MTPPVRRVLTAAAAVALASGLSACGGDETPAADATGSPSASPSSSPSSPSSTPTSTETTAAPEPTPQSSGPATLSAKAFAAVVDDALDDTSGADISVENGLGFLSGEGQIDFRQDPSSLAMTLTSSETGDDQQIVVRVIGQVMYLEDEKKFLKIDIDSPANPFGSSLSDQLDPRQVLDAIEADLTSATSEGTVEQGGESLDVYRAVADGPAVVQKLAPDLAGQQGVVVPPSVVCDVKVDDDGHARKIVVDLGPENGQLAYSIDNWRTDVSIQVPPAGQVSDLTLPNG